MDLNTPVSFHLARGSGPVTITGHREVSPCNADVSIVQVGWSDRDLTADRDDKEVTAVEEAVEIHEEIIGGLDLVEEVVGVAEEELETAEEVGVMGTQDQEDRRKIKKLRRKHRLSVIYHSTVHYLITQITIILLIAPA